MTLLSVISRISCGRGRGGGEQGVADQGRQVGVAELCGGQVYRDGDRVCRRVVQWAAVGQGGVEHERGEFFDQAGGFGQGDELVRGEVPRVGWYQRTRASTLVDGAGGEVDFGLVVDGEFVRAFA